MNEKKLCTVYIDEAGDLGVNTGTQWFVLSGVIIEKEDEKDIRAKISFIKNKLNINEIHIRKIRDFNKRAYAVKTLAGENFTYINILANTQQLDTKRFPSALLLYNFMCRMLLERVSWCLRDTNRTADIVLSSRGTNRDKELIHYIQNKLLTDPNNEIEKVFQKISAKSASQWDMLQIADVCATTMFLSHNVNEFGFCFPCFVSALSDHLYTYNDKLIKYGIKYLNDTMQPKLSDLMEHRLCKKK